MAGTRKKGGGRKRAPSALRALTGGRNRTPAINEAQVDASIPATPPGLSAEGRREWKRVAPILRDCGILTELDRAVLAVYCIAWGRMIRAEQKMRHAGMVKKSPNGHIQPSTWLSIARAARAEMMSAASELGMTPASRTKINVRPPALRAPEAPPASGPTKRERFFPGGA